MISVTTFSKSGYELYGRNFLNGFVDHFPSNIIVYYESLPDFEHKKIVYRNFFDIPNTQIFYNYIKNIPMAHGITEIGYRYNYDLWKFSRKVFAQYDVLKSYRGKVFWLDADIKFKEKVPKKWLEDLFEDKPLVYLAREGFHTETGFVGFDTDHSDFPPFLEKYINCLRKGVILTLTQWHDCAAFDYAREGIEGKDLAEGIWDQNKKLSLYGLDVFNKSVLNKYMDHVKGNRKIMKDAKEGEKLISKSQLLY